MEPTPKPKTRAQILETAGILFSQRGYFGVSMSQIAKEVGITKAALYYHFESKEELYRVLVARVTDQLASRLKDAVKKAKTPLDKLLGILEAYLIFALEQPEIALLTKTELEDDSLLGEFIAQARSELIELLKTTIVSFGETRRKSEELVIFLTSLCFNVLSQPVFWVYRTPKKMAEWVADLLFPKVTMGLPSKPLNK